MKERLIVYIDGFNLYFGIKAAGLRACYWLDPHCLSTLLLKSDQDLEAVHYFTSRITPSAADPDKHKRQHTWLEAIALLPLIHLHFGHYIKKNQKCFSCQATWESHEEKMTDVNIAVKLLQDAYEDRFDVAIVISADSDLVPPIELLRDKFPNKRVISVFPPQRSSKRLSQVASASFPLGEALLRKCQLPEQCPKPDGFVLTRPSTWK